MRQEVYNKVNIQQLHWKERTNILKRNVKVLSIAEEDAVTKQLKSLYYLNNWIEK